MGSGAVLSFPNDDILNAAHVPETLKPFFEGQLDKIEEGVDLSVCPKTS
jgi:hypothetical protein